MITTIAQLNKANADSWIRRLKRFDYLTERKYAQQFLKGTFVVSVANAETPAEAFERVRQELPFETQLINFCESADSISDKRLFAREPRRKAKNGVSQRDIIADLGSKSENRALSAKQLWPLLFQYLQYLGLNPLADKSSDIYTYEGTRGKRISISFRQFQKTISDVCPRRRAR